MKSPATSWPRLSRPALLSVAAAAITGGLLGCATSRNQALQERQDWLNEQAAERAERRQIRSDNADARNQAYFDAL